MPYDTWPNQHDAGLKLSKAARLNRARQWRRELTSSAVDLLFPPACAYCDVPLAASYRRGRLLCEGCQAALRTGESEHFCSFCGVPLPQSWPPEAKCPSCPARSAVDRVIPLGVYCDDLRQAVIRAKQFFEHPLAATLGSLLAEELIERDLAQAFDVVIPIPKYWIKRIIRGTNTAEVLAESIARIMDRPLLPGALTSCRKTRKQSLLGKTERQRNVRGAFRVAKGYDFREARVLIVDDIMTTGATAQDAARVLRKSGADWIALAVVARAVGLQTR